MRFLFSRQFEHFCAVYATRNLRQAAAQVGVTQPALSKSIQALERNLGTELFERTARGMIPTTAGTMLRQRLVNMERQAEYAELEVGGLVEGTGGTIHIGSGLVWGWKQMPQVLSQFHSEFPNIHLEVTSGITDVLLPMLLNGDLDIIVSDMHDVTVPNEFRINHVWSTGRRPWVRAGHPLARKAAVTWGDLGRYKWAGHNADTRLTKHVTREYDEIGVRPPTIILKTSSLMTMLAVVAGSDLIGIFADDLAPDARRHKLRPLPIGTEGWELHAGLVYRAEATNIRPFKRLIAIARNLRQRSRNDGGVPRK
jgi:DNA-binding transcriptional LysR family regulator